MFNQDMTQQVFTWVKPSRQEPPYYTEIMVVTKEMVTIAYLDESGLWWYFVPNTLQQYGRVDSMPYGDVIYWSHKPAIVLT